VLVHGYGADGNDLIGLAPHFQRAMPTVSFVAPNAPTRLPGSPGYQWFPISRLDPKEMQAGVAMAAPVLDAFLDAELARLKLGRERLMLIGFSQGTMLSLAVGLSKPCAAILGYSGILTNDALPELGPEAPPVLLVHGDQDATIPIEALL
jgi:phospholipase/carboxylesterase